MWFAIIITSFVAVIIIIAAIIIINAMVIIININNNQPSLPTGATSWQPWLVVLGIGALSWWRSLGGNSGCWWQVIELKMVIVMVIIMVIMIMIVIMIVIHLLQKA